MPAGACRCCLAAGRFRSVWRRYAWLGEAERYADLLRDALHVQIPEQDDSRDGAVICAVCITRLRDAYNFKKQVLACGLQLAEVSEKKEGAVESELVPNVQPADRSSEEAPPETEQTASNDELIELYELEQPENSQAADEGDDGTADNDEEYIIAIEVEDEDGARLSQLPSGFEIPIIKSVKRHKRRLPEEAGTSRRKRPRSASQETPECVTVKAENSEEKIVRKTSSRALKRNQPQPAKKTSRLPTHAHVMTVNNAAQIIEYSQACPFKCRHSTYTCFYCGLEFTEPHALRTHTQTIHKATKRDIIYSIKSKNDLVKIDITCLNCKLCDAQIPDLESLKAHLTNIHGKTFIHKATDGILPFILDEKLACVVCGKSFLYFRALNQHMNEHFSMHVCERCGCGFATLTRLNVHVRTHDTENSPCHLCGKVFRTRLKLQKHIQLYHERRGRLICSQCPERFVDYHQKLKHLIKVHNAKPLSFKCNDCEKVFPSRRRLTTHTKRDHLMERRFHCTYCDQKFFTKFVLKNHLTRHTKERDYKCAVCAQSYSMQKTLNEHVRKHHRSATCGVCGQSFSKNAELVIHMRASHPHESLDRFKLWEGGAD